MRTERAAELLHSSGVPAAATRERPSRSSGAVVERRVVGQVDREAELADEQLRGGDVDRARRLERADGVDAAGGEVAERERERAHDPQAVGEADHRGGLLGDERR